MKKEIWHKLAALLICICLAAECFGYVGVGTVYAQDVSEAGAENISEEAAENLSEEADEMEKESDAVKDRVDADASADTQGAVDDNTAVDTMATQISFKNETSIVIQFKKTVSKVNSDPDDGKYYCKGSNMRPVMLVYYDKEISDISNISKDKVVEKNGKTYQRTLLTKNTDYTVDYPDETTESCKYPGKYELVVKAKSANYTGSRTIAYELVEKEHDWSAWKTTVNATVFNEGSKQRTCSICKKVETKVIAKAKATIKLNMTKITLKRKQSTTKFKVSSLAAGDYVKSYKSSNKKIFTIDKKGKIKAKNKSGTAKLTVTLASGKKATAKVKVQKGTVKTTKLTVNTSSLVLLKGGNYTLKTARSPLTTQQKVTFSSSNKKVATVSSKGVITAKKKGTAKITVKSGSKKKTVKVTVQVPTFPKGDTNAFLKSCQKIAGIIENDGNWIYYSGSGMKKSFAEARAYNPRRTSCANFVNFCMQDFGTLEPGMAFYSDGNGKLIYQGNSSMKAATKAMVEQNYDIINIGGKKAVDAGLQPGDICLYKGHTNVFAGLNSEGVPTWYDGGRNSTADGKPGSVFTHMFRTSYLNSMPVYIVLRMKK